MSQFFWPLSQPCQSQTYKSYKKKVKNNSTTTNHKEQLEKLQKKTANYL